jgi:hypothetical protein
MGPDVPVLLLEGLSPSVWPPVGPVVLKGISPPVTRLEQQDLLVGKQDGISPPVTKLEQQDPLVVKQEGINPPVTRLVQQERIQRKRISSLGSTSMTDGSCD